MVTFFRWVVVFGIVMVMVLPALALAQDASPVSSSSQRTAYPLTIETCGRSVTFEEAPRRVVATYPTVADLLIRLGLGDRIVASAWHTNFPSAAEVSAEYEAIGNQYEGWPSREEFFSLRPDFVLAAFDAYDFDPAAGMASLAEVEAAGIGVYGMSTDCAAGVDPTLASLEFVYSNIRELGRIFDVQPRAEALVAEMQMRVAAVDQLVAERPAVGVIVTRGGDGTLGVLTRGLYSDLVKRAGGTSLFPDVEGVFAQVSPEEIAIRAPEVFVVVGEGEAASAVAETLLATFPADLTGRGQRVAIVSDGQLTPGFRTVEAVEIMARAFHPEGFADASPTTGLGGATSYPVTVETCGRPMTFEQAPERILVSYPTMTDTLFQLGLGDKIVGLSWKDGSDPLPEYAEAYAALPAVSTEGPAAKEPLLATRADFFFADGEYLFDPESGYATLDDLTASGMHAYVAASGCPDRRDTGTVADVYTDIANLGRIFDVQDEATELIVAEQARIEAVQKAIAGQPLPRVAFAGVYGAELYALTGGTYGDIMRLAGADNIFADLGMVFAPISAEEMLAENPEVLLVSYNVAAEIDAKGAEIRDRFPGLAAVVNGQVVPVQEGTTSPGSTRAILAIELLARELHPAAFPDGATPEPA